MCISYECDRCESTFETLTALTRHLLPILSMEVQEAGLREELFARIEERDRRGILKGILSEYNVPLRQIDDKKHRREEHYICHLCMEVFPERMGLREHFWSHARRLLCANSG